MICISDSPKPGGAIWKTGIHKVSLDGKPVRLSAPQYSLIQNYNLMKRKIEENGHIPIGIDHISPEVIQGNPVLRKLLEAHEIDPYDVGKILDVSTDGEQIRIENAEFTNDSVKELFLNGELTAWSVVENARTLPCPTGKADLVADYFSDIERVDLVGRGGCETCLVEGGGVPDGYNRINASFMEVDKLSDEEKKKKGNEGNPEDETGTGNPEDENGQGNPGDEGDSGAEGNPENKNGNEDEKPPSQLDTIQDTVTKLVGTVETLSKTVTGIVDGTIKAKLPEEYEQKFQEIDDIKLEASKSKVGAMIDAKIQAGYVTPAMKEGLLEAGLSMSEDGFKKLLAGYTQKLWDPKKYSNPSDEDSGGDVLYIDVLRKSREKNRY